MDQTDDVPNRCRRCGAVNSTDKTVCGLCGKPLKEPVSSPEPVETGLSPILALNEHQLKAPKAFAKTPPSALSILLRSFLILLGGCVVVASIFISFFATCLVVSVGERPGLTGSFILGVLAGLVATGFVGFIEFHTFKIFYRIFSTPRNDR